MPEIRAGIGFIDAGLEPHSALGGGLELDIVLGLAALNRIASQT